MPRDESRDVMLADFDVSLMGIYCNRFSDRPPMIRYVPHAHLVDIERQLSTLKSKVAEVVAFGFSSLTSNENTTVRAMANSLEQLVR